MSHLYLINPRGLGSLSGLNLPLKLEEGNNMKKMKAIRLRVLLSLNSTKKTLRSVRVVAVMLLMKTLRVTWGTLRLLALLAVRIKRFLVDNCSPSKELVMKWSSDCRNVALFLIGTGLVGIIAPSASQIQSSHAYITLLSGLGLWLFVAIASAYFENKMNKLNQD